MSRTPRPILDVATGNLMLMIALHRNKPCPSRREISEWTGVQRRRIWAWLAELQERGLVEVEIAHEGCSTIRRLRVFGQPWTGWTARGASGDAHWRRKQQLMADAAGVSDGSA